MKRIIACLSILAIFAIPSVASAHSGHVTCDSTGVVYHYDANFPANTAVVEHVNGVNYNFIPATLTASTHTDPLPGVASVTASATWSGGGTIPPTTLTCPVPAPPPVIPPPVTPPPVVPPAVVCPPNTVDLGMSGMIKLCGIIEPPPPPPFAMCPKGYVSTGVHNNVLTCVRTKIKIVNKIQWKIRYIQWCKIPPKKGHPELG